MKSPIDPPTSRDPLEVCVPHLQCVAEVFNTPGIFDALQLSRDDILALLEHTTRAESIEALDASGATARAAALLNRDVDESLSRAVLLFCKSRMEGSDLIDKKDTPVTSSLDEHLDEMEIRRLPIHIESRHTLLYDDTLPHCYEDLHSSLEVGIEDEQNRNILFIALFLKVSTSLQNFVWRELNLSASSGPFASWVQEEYRSQKRTFMSDRISTGFASLAHLVERSFTPFGSLSEQLSSLYSSEDLPIIFQELLLGCFGVQETDALSADMEQKLSSVNREFKNFRAPNENELALDIRSAAEVYFRNTSCIPNYFAIYSYFSIQAFIGEILAVLSEGFCSFTVLQNATPDLFLPKETLLCSSPIRVDFFSPVEKQAFDEEFETLYTSAPRDARLVFEYIVCSVFSTLSEDLTNTSNSSFDCTDLKRRLLTSSCISESAFFNIFKQALLICTEVNANLSAIDSLQALRPFQKWMSTEGLLALFGNSNTQKYSDTTADDESQIPLDSRLFDSISVRIEKVTAEDQYAFLRTCLDSFFFDMVGVQGGRIPRHYDLHRQNGGSHKDHFYLGAYLNGSIPVRQLPQEYEYMSDRAVERFYENTLSPSDTKVPVFVICVIQILAQLRFFIINIKSGNFDQPLIQQFNSSHTGDAPIDMKSVLQSFIILLKGFPRRPTLQAATPLALQIMNSKPFLRASKQILALTCGLPVSHSLLSSLSQPSVSAADDEVAESVSFAQQYLKNRLCYIDFPSLIPYILQQAVEDVIFMKNGKSAPFLNEYAYFESSGEKTTFAAEILGSETTGLSSPKATNDNHPIAPQSSSTLIKPHITLPASKFSDEQLSEISPRATKELLLLPPAVIEERPALLASYLGGPLRSFLNFEEVSNTYAFLSRTVRSSALQHHQLRFLLQVTTLQTCLHLEQAIGLVAQLPKEHPLYQKLAAVLQKDSFSAGSMQHCLARGFSKIISDVSKPSRKKTSRVQAFHVADLSSADLILLSESPLSSLSMDILEKVFASRSDDPVEERFYGEYRAIKKSLQSSRIAFPESNISAAFKILTSNSDAAIYAHTVIDHLSSQIPFLLGGARVILGQQIREQDEQKRLEVLEQEEALRLDTLVESCSNDYLELLMQISAACPDASVARMDTLLRALPDDADYSDPAIFESLKSALLLGDTSTLEP